MSSLPGCGPVQARERLHGLDAGEPLVDVHRVQQRLVEAGLVLLGHEQHLVLVGRELLGQLASRGCRRSCPASVYSTSGVRVLDRAGERHQRLDVGVALLLDVVVERLLVADRVRAASRSRPSPWPGRRSCARVNVRKCSTMTSVFWAMLCGWRLTNRASAWAALLLARPAGSSSTALHQPVVGLVGRVVLQHVEDEALLDRLPHRCRGGTAAACRRVPARRTPPASWASAWR